MHSENPEDHPNGALMGCWGAQSHATNKVWPHASFPVS